MSKLLEQNEQPSTLRLKSPAVEFGRNIAKKQHTEFFNHGKDGKIQSRDSYGNDPFPPKG